MSNTGSSDSEYSDAKLPQIKVRRPHYEVDMATIFGLIIALGLIIIAIFLGEAQAQFF